MKGLRKYIDKNFIIVTPGIRPKWGERNDQKRIMTPSEAIKLGANYLVIGRPITGAKDPALAFEKLCSEV